MKTFIKFVLIVTDANHENGSRHQGKVTVVAVTSATAYETYYQKTKRYEVQVNSILSADLIGEEEYRVLSKDEAVLISDDALRIFLKI